MRSLYSLSFFFFFNDTATTEIYTLSLHDALPISFVHSSSWSGGRPGRVTGSGLARVTAVGVKMSLDRKSTRLNSSHDQISYAVFCLKKKKHTMVGFGGHASRDYMSVQRCPPIFTA